jgi:hypothetical protein
MANVPEQSQWESGIYQFEETDPVQGGPDGIDNLPNKQLANRTRYLRDWLDSLQASVDAVGAEGQNALWIAVENNASMVGLLEQELQRQKFVRHQEGEFVLTNRGIIRGCGLTASTGATRNLNIAPGAVFMLGREWGVAAKDNAASVPNNTTATTGAAYAYLYVSASGMALSVTSLNEPAPDDALVLASITIPAGSTGASDPNLANVTITTTARREPNWPWVQSSPAYQQQDFERVMGKSNYHLAFDIAEWDGERPSLVSHDTDRAANTFRAYLMGSADNVRVRYVAHLMHQ